MHRLRPPPLLLRLCSLLATGGLVLMLNGCAVVAVADAAVTVVATGVKVTAKTVGAVVDVIIPDKEKDD